MELSKNKNTNMDSTRLLGAAFLLQAIASAISYLVLRDPLIDPDGIVDTMTNIARSALQMRASIVFEMITVIWIAMLGALLFVVLKKQNMKVALVAMGLYLVEVSLLAVSSLAAFGLLRTSQESVLAGHPEHLQSLGRLIYEAMEFANDLHMLPFAVGATLFYCLVYRSRLLPRSLALLGLVAAPVALAAILMELLGVALPIYVYMPNLPFELGAGLWLLIKGAQDSPAPK